MGSATSKASRAAGAAARQYPTRPPPTSQPAATINASATAAAPPPPPPSPAAAAPNRAPGPNVRPPPYAADSRSAEINSDASDPDFAASLRSIGPVQPNSTMSESSVFPQSSNPNNASQTIRPSAPNPRSNPAIAVLESRSKLQDEAELEFLEAGKRGHGGRQFLDIYTVRQMLVLRDEKRQSAAQIEKALGLKAGSVDRLGSPGVVAIAQESIGRQKVEMV